MAWNDAYNMGSAFPLMDYGSNKLAEYANQNLGNNRNTNRYSGLEYGQQYFPDEEVVDETVTDINRPLPDYYTQRFGKQAFPHTGFNMPAAATSNYIQRKEPGTLRNIWEGTKNIASKAKGAPLGLLNLLTQRQGATESFGGYPGGQFSRAGLFPQEVSNLQQLADANLLRSGAKDFTGTNVVSQFGNYNQHMADKKAQFEAKLKDTDYLSTLGNPDDINTLEDLYRAYQTKYGKNSAIAKRLNHYANWTNRTGTAADKITDTVTDVTRPGDGVTPAGPVTTGGGGTFDPVLDPRGRTSRGAGAAPSWRGATAAREAAGQQVAGPGFGRGAYWAKGGRVGLRLGGGPEEPSENIFEFMQDQGINYDQTAEGVDQKFLSDELGAIDVDEETLAMITDLLGRETDVSTISTLTGKDEGTIERVIRVLTTQSQAQGGSVGYSDGGLASLV